VANNLADDREKLTVHTLSAAKPEQDFIDRCARLAAGVGFCGEKPRGTVFRVDARPLPA